MWVRIRESAPPRQTVPRPRMRKRGLRGDPKLMLGACPRIVSPGLCKVVTFALDEEGYLSDHACQYLFPRRGSSIGFDGFSRELGTVLGREVSVEETLAYCLAFLYSSYAP